ncbi:MAG TPA: hypothetical protein VFL92_02725 [Sphingomonas sp.]|nr:hypothetical protein [Sphingomonas sp.]
MGVMAQGGRSVIGIADRLAALLDEDGCARHPWPAALVAGHYPDSTRDLADAAHLLCMLHARYPGVIDHAANRTPQSQARDWLYRAAAGFASERGYLTRLVVAVGPLPSTPGQAQSEAVVTAQRHALATLSQSDRAGTAFGAAMALALDWPAIRPMLDAASDRVGLVPPPLDLPSFEDTIGIATMLADTPGLDRAMGFGAEQLLAQHRGLWDLLESRAAARSAD